MMTIEPDVMDHVTGGLGSLFGLRSAYRGAVNGITAGFGGWQLANKMYGTPEHGAPLAEKWRAMKAMKGYLDAGDRLPSWAPNW
jgi:hypothetical protein